MILSGDRLMCAFCGKPMAVKTDYNRHVTECKSHPMHGLLQVIVKLGDEKATLQKRIEALEQEWK